MDSEVDTNRAAARRFADEVLTGHDLDVLPELVAEDFIEQNPPPGQGPGRDGLRQFLSALFDAFPDLQWRPQEMVAEGDRVATWSIWSGTHSGDFFGVPATGRQVSVEAWTMDRFRDGLMVESRILMDVAGLMQQLGA
ncbi:ester cyclase [Actinomycetospora sp. NBRC 106375]|uniref:ester cyclase n=1 Tax=Actinomycetospora sp. NBRC 106375 TaxID=3032207 RepID=UPI002555C7F3|nr:ester cyclase [Actinomycetospora sp. NBRC 106375]